MNNNNNNSTTTRKWSDLSPLPLKLINNKLNQYYPNILVRLICKKWRNSVRPPLARLHRFLPVSISFQEPGSLESVTFPPLRLVRATVCLFRRNSEYPWWMASVEKTTPGKHLRLFHPLTRSRIPMELLHDDIIPNLEFIELSKAYNLRCYDGLHPAFGHLPQNFSVNKVILWSDGNEGSATYTVVMLHDHGKLDCVRLPYENDRGVFYITSVTPIAVPSTPTSDIGSTSYLMFDDVELWKWGMLWAVDHEARLFGINYHSLIVTTYGGGGIPIYQGCGSNRLLVVRDILWVIVCKCKDIQRCDDVFLIYQATEDLRWEPLVSLRHNGILFVGFDTCFLCITDILEGFPGNCIVFPKRLYPMYTDNEIRDGVDFHGQLDYLDLCVGRYRQPGFAAVQQVSGHPNLSSAFWPPPASIFKSFVEIIDLDDDDSDSESTTNG